MIDVDLLQRIIGFPTEFFSLRFGHPAEILLKPERNWLEAVSERFGLYLNVTLGYVGFVYHTCSENATLIYSRTVSTDSIFCEWWT